MRTEFRVFGVVAVFLFLAAGVYYWWTWTDSGGDGEWIGTIALALSGLLCAMCGWYFWVVSRRIDPRPEDRADAEVSDGAGEIGFFSPGSYYPFGLGLATFVAGLGIAYFQWWLIAVGLLGVLVGTGGLLFEYYTGARRSSH